MPPRQEWIDEEAATSPREWQAYTIRIPKSMFQRFKHLHVQTYPTHQLNFDTWLMVRLKQIICDS